jgi:hypothetical protein
MDISCVAFLILFRLLSAITCCHFHNWTAITLHRKALNHRTNVPLNSGTVSLATIWRQLPQYLGVCTTHTWMTTYMDLDLGP